MKRKRHPKKDIKQVQVPCPRKIQKTILKNLQKSAKSRINKSRAQKSAKLLKMFTKQSKKVKEARR